MIAKLKGTVDEIRVDSMLIDVGGVCYIVYAGAKLLSSVKIGEQTFVNIFHIFKQENQILFGYRTQDELVLFKNLVNVPGIGVKTAISVMAVLSPEDFARAVTHSDADTLLRVEGIGKKTAMRILSELKDNIVKSGILTNIGREDRINDAILGLISLGYRKNDVILAVNKVLEKNAFDDKPAATDQLIVLCLRELN
jgi:Holliday junction DNA helicase RuvA